MSHRFAINGLRAAIAAIFVGSALAAAATEAVTKHRPVDDQPRPSAAADLGGTDSTLEGTMEIEVADYPDQTSRLHHFVRTESGERHRLRFSRDAHDFKAGARVRLKGRFAASDVDGQTEQVLQTENNNVQELAAAMPYASGTQRTAVILVNFQDNTSRPQTADAVRNLIFGSVNNYIKENSFQTTSLSGDVFGWYTMPVSSGTCSTSTIKTAARNAATAAGVNLSGYTRFIYVFPNISACSWAGYGQIGGSPTDSWINGYFDRGVIAHELGHNFGLRHAHSKSCGSASIGTSCTTSEYGDLVDTMGWGLYGHLSAYQKEYLGWLNYNGLPPITTVQSSGTFTLTPYASTAGGGVRALKIPKGADSTGAQSYYYVEFRQPIGFDAGLAGTGNLTSGVQIRSAGAASAGASLLDMTPNSNTSSDYNDFKDSALAVGKTFTDATAKISITVKSVSASGAVVAVSVGGVPVSGSGTSGTSCTRGKPVVTLSPGQTSATAGKSVSYSVAVSNKDSSACGTSTFNLARSVPGGWSGALNTGALSIAPGATANATLTVTSPSSTGAGTYSVGATATSAASSQAGSGYASYVIGSSTGTTSGTTVQAPIAANDNVTTTAGTAVTFRPLANDRDPAGKTLTLVKVDPAGKGSVTKNADGSVTYKPYAGQIGWDGFTYTISNGTKTAWATIYMQIK